MDYSLLIPDCIDYYLNSFQRTDYPAVFQHYCQQTRPVWDDIGMADPEGAAKGMVDWIDAHPGRFFKKRRMADRQMLMLQYTAPAAVKMGHEDFANALSRVWKERHPQYSFRVGTYEALVKGFNNTLLGFQLPSQED